MHTNEKARENNSNIWMAVFKRKRGLKCGSGLEVLTELMLG